MSNQAVDVLLYNHYLRMGALLCQKTMALLVTFLLLGYPFHKFDREMIVSTRVNCWWHNCMVIHQTTHRLLYNKYLIRLLNCAQNYDHEIILSTFVNCWWHTCVVIPLTTFVLLMIILWSEVLYWCQRKCHLGYFCCLATLFHTINARAFENACPDLFIAA